MGQDSLVSISTRYGLDGPGTESWWRKDFGTRPERSWGSHSPLCDGYRVIPSGKAAGTWSSITTQNLGLRLKKGYSYIPTPSLGFRGLFHGISIPISMRGKDEEKHHYT